MEAKYAELLGLEFWLEDWFKEDFLSITVTLPVGIKFSTVELAVTSVEGNNEWLIIKIRKSDNI
jgi:hypothetical protein